MHRFTVQRWADGRIAGISIYIKIILYNIDMHDMPSPSIGALLVFVSFQLGCSFPPCFLRASLAQFILGSEIATPGLRTPTSRVKKFEHLMVPRSQAPNINPLEYQGLACPLLILHFP